MCCSAAIPSMWQKEMSENDIVAVIKFILSTAHRIINSTFHNAYLICVYSAVYLIFHNVWMLGQTSCHVLFNSV